MASAARYACRKRRAVLLDLFCHDRHARAAHDHWRGNSDCDYDSRGASPLQSRVLRACRDLRTLLALCGHCLDIFVSAALFIRPPSGRTPVTIADCGIRIWLLIADI